MKDTEVIRRKINELEAVATEIEEIEIELLQIVTLIYKPDPPGVICFAPNYEWGKLSGENQHKQRDVLRKYQRWYTVAHQLVKEYIPERVDEFSQYYSSDKEGTCGVIDYIKFEQPQWSGDKSGITDDFWRIFEVQRSILLSVPDIIEIKQMSLRNIISAEFIDREIDEADYLYRMGHPRAAGALAGVALEQQLKTLCDKYNLEYQKRDTTEPLAQRLYENDRIDITQLKNIQHLASIRDKCDHASDITSDEVRELIERLKKLILQLS
jgi:hypothetical protein